jgi:hypothetical protein
MRLFAVSVDPIRPRVDAATFSVAIAERRVRRRPVELHVIMSHARRGKTGLEPSPHGIAIEG